MGVSGAGKSTVAGALAARREVPLAEGDSFHSAANVAKMRAGTPLTDADRWPWLAAIGAWISAQAPGRGAVVTCSALRRSYRDALRDGRPRVRFCHLVASADVLTERLRQRGGHFMPASLLPSQLDALEPLAADELATDSVVVAANEPVDVVVARALAALGFIAG